MYLYTGNTSVIFEKDIIGIFDLDKITTFKPGREYLNNLQKDGKIVDISEKLPKSFIVCDGIDGEKVYLSPLAASTLSKRNLNLLT